MPMNKTITLLSLALFSSHALAVQTDQDIDRLMPLSLDELLDVQVAISTRGMRQMSKAPSVVSVITAEDIKSTGATNLMDILQSVPGVYIKRNLFAFRPLISLRGAPGTHTLLMVNGMPMRDLVWSNGIFWQGLPASIIERVEIIRGPGSALFGADASAGVINVITRTAAPMADSEVGLRAGSFETRAGWLRHGANSNGVDIGITAELSGTDGHRPYIPRAGGGTSGHVNYEVDSQDLRFSLARGHWRLLADYMRHDDLGAGINGAGVLDPANRSSDSQYSLALLYDNPLIAPDWGLSAAVRYRDLEYSSGTGFYITPISREKLDSAERQAGFDVSGLYTGVRGHAIRMGAGFAWNDIYRVRHVNPPDPTHPIPETGRGNTFLYLQDIWSLGEHWELTAGARYDHYDDFGDAFTPRLALVWQATDRLTAKLMYGEAFRAPSFQELYFKTSSNTPNPDLSPERSNTWELAFDYLAAKNLRLGLNLYRFERTNLIAADPVTKQFQNFGEFAVRGMELEAVWQAAPSFRLSGNLDCRHEDEATSRDLSVPTKSAHLRLDWAFLPRWNWDLQANWFGARPLPATDTRRELGAYSLVDTTLRYRSDSRWEFAVSLRNLFDESGWDYSSRFIPDNLPLPGRNAYVELRRVF